MKVLICGGDGQLAREFSAFLKHTYPDAEVRAPSHTELDVTMPHDIQAHIKTFAPTIVINTAAYHKVDECESNIQRTFEVNTHGACAVASVARNNNIRSLFISTGFVFDGLKNTSYSESDKTNPINIYGHSKALAEKIIRFIDPDALIIRTNGLYGIYSDAKTKGGSGNFVDFVVRNALAGKNLEIVSDQRLTPTYTSDFVEAAWKLLDNKVAGGVYHISNSGLTTWYNVASTIYKFLNAKGTVHPISSEQRHTDAKRPKNALLVSEKIKETLPHWENALKRYLREKYSLTL